MATLGGREWYKTISPKVNLTFSARQLWLGGRFVFQLDNDTEYTPEMIQRQQGECSEEARKMDKYCRCASLRHNPL